MEGAVVHTNEVAPTTPNDEAAPTTPPIEPAEPMPTAEPTAAEDEKPPVEGLESTATTSPGEQPSSESTEVAGEAMQREQPEQLEKEAVEGSSSQGPTDAADDQAACSQDDRLLSMIDEDHEEAHVEKQAESEEIEDVPTEAVKKGRGRPKKEADATQPIEEQSEAATAKRKRGRPKVDAEADGQPSPKAPRIEQATPVLTKDVFGEDPDDVRLTIDGAVCEGDTPRLALKEYSEFKRLFTGEPLPEKHPDPSRPGMKPDELPGGSCAVNLVGLRNWSDPKGEGWIAYRQTSGSQKSESRWFNARVWGSWRLAFLLAKLQRDVWHPPGDSDSTATAPARSTSSRSTEPKEGTSGSSSSSTRPGKEKKQNFVPLTGNHEWLAFSPRQMNTNACLARTWSDGQGGQCENPRREGSELCSHHQALATSKRGLLYGLVNGPIPAAKLLEFQQAALLVGETAEVQTKDGRAQKLKRPRPQLSASQRKALCQRGRPKFDASATEKSEEASTFASAAQAAAAAAEPLRRRRKGPERLSKREVRHKNQQFWNTVDDAMDAAIKERERDFGFDKLLQELLDEKGLLRESAMAKAINAIKIIKHADMRFKFVRILYNTAQADLVRAASFVLAGGVGALRPWLQSALPPEVPSSEHDAKRREDVVLACLKLLRLLPVTMECLQDSAIGRTLQALRCYCVPAQVAAGELITLWKNKFRDVLSQPTSSPSKPPASKPPASKPPATTVKASSSTSAPPAQTQAAKQPVPPAAPTTDSSKAPKSRYFPSGRPIVKGRAFARRQQPQQPHDELEATLQQLFLLGEVLEGQSSATSSTQKVVEIDLSEDE